MGRYNGLAAIAAVVISSAVLMGTGVLDRDVDSFLVVGHRYRCIVPGDDYEILVHQVIDHQWVRADLLDSGEPSRGADAIPMLVNLSRVNAIMPLDPSELPARFQKKIPQ